MTFEPGQYPVLRETTGEYPAQRSFHITYDVLAGGTPDDVGSLTLELSPVESSGGNGILDRLWRFLGGSETPDDIERDVLMFIHETVAPGAVHTAAVAADDRTSIGAAQVLSLPHAAECRATVGFDSREFVADTRDTE